MQEGFNSCNTMLFIIFLNILGFLHARTSFLGQVLKLLRLMQHLNIQEREIFKSNQLCGSTTMMPSSYTLEKIGLLRNLYPREEPLRFRIDLPNLEGFSLLLYLFKFGRSIRNLKGSSLGYRFRNKPIFLECTFVLL